MNESYEFLKAVVDTLPEHIVVIDKKGTIQFVNHSWNKFGRDNLCSIDSQWNGVNYLDECDKAADMGDVHGHLAAEGIRKVMESKLEQFYFEYPCNDPDQKRWFMMQVTPLKIQGTDYFVISHTNITQRKLAEEAALNLSRIDGLTGISNRRFFDEFIQNEWKRCARLSMPLSLAIIDVDYFKLINDTYGHQVGDDCLKKVSSALKKAARRPGDIVARYGGDEFVMVFSNTTLQQATSIISELKEDIHSMNIPNEQSPRGSILTVSIGLATMRPDNRSSWTELLGKADAKLYSAKEDRKPVEV
jgi:diguanylate cyclase (GGDEF)-like protein